MDQKTKQSIKQKVTHKWAKSNNLPILYGLLVKGDSAGQTFVKALQRLTYDFF